QDRYNDPGTPVMRLLTNGQRAIMQNGDSIYLIGAGAGPEGDRPFLDQFNLQTLKGERLFRSGTDGYESVTALLRDDGKQFLTRDESPTTPPNYFIRRVTGQAVASDGVDNSTSQPLTQFADPTPQLKG